MKKQIHYFAPLLVLASLSACGLEPQERYERAQESFAQSNFEAARLDLVSALKEQAGDSRLLTLLARTQIAMGDGEGALLTLDTLGKSSSKPDDFLALLAEAEVLRGQFDQALEIVAGEQSTSAYRAAALAHIGLKNVESAREAIDSGLAINAEDAALLATSARFELATGNSDLARQRADLALKVAPRMHDALLVAAQISASTNRLSAALAAYDQGLKAHPASIEIRMGKIATLGDLDRIEEASGLLDETVKMAPENDKLLFLQARLAIENSDWNKARSLLQDKESLLRNNPNMQIIYAQALLELGQVEQARTWLLPIVRRYPGQRFARQLLGDSQLRSGDARDAFATLRILAQRPDASPQELGLAAKAAQLIGDPLAKDFSDRAKLPAPEWFGGEMAKADAALRNGNWALASKSYQRIADRLARPNAMVLNNLAYAKGKQGKQQEAVKLALRAVAVDPENASVLDTAGVLLIESGTDRQRGKAFLMKAANLAPENRAIARHLAQAQ
ncbi:hypothetical protein GCM10023115_24170 [Pontixanthobacter gangjinensis]|uniref:Tetratricopeptide repeat protein n=1 Tax=Pontixanthobacter gangjinensis TaxID=1028742 RepID=A0A6I4SPU0_9SPHN|nr:tetratricopeptide repeat protein [Pontixanthobacter gangjinensis]MXO57659.1 tetratricopeptide repeat protein [Pontixanthobacter gangjinensis]